MKKDYTMRMAQLEDIEFLLALRIETMEEHLLNSGMRLNRHEHKARVLHNFEHAKIISYQGEKIGVLKLLKKDTTYEIEQFQIKKKYQGKGIGKEILEEIIKKAASEERSIKLSVLKKNKAKNLYQRIGFNIIGEDETSYFMIIM